MAWPMSKNRRSPTRRVTPRNEFSFDASGNTHFPSPHDPPASSPFGEMPMDRKKPQKSLPCARMSLARMSPWRPVVP